MIITPFALAEKLENTMPGEVIIYHQGFIGYERGKNENLNEAFDRLYTFIELLNTANFIFSYSERQGDLKYNYAVKTIKPMIPAVVAVGLELTKKKGFDEAWFVTTKLNQLLLG